MLDEGIVSQGTGGMEGGIGQGGDGIDGGGGVGWGGEPIKEYINNPGKRGVPPPGGGGYQSNPQ